MKDAAIGSPREELREAIIRTSLELGAQHGEEGLTIRGIAAKLAISVTALYQHFDSKAEILRELRVRGLQRIIDAALAAFENDDARQAFLEASRAYVSFAREQPWLYRLLFEGEGLASNELTPEQRQFVQVGEVRIREAVRAKYGSALDERQLPHFFGRWLAGLHGVCSLTLHHQLPAEHALLGIPELDLFIAEYLEFLADGLLASIGHSRVQG